MTSYFVMVNGYPTTPLPYLDLGNAEEDFIHRCNTAGDGSIVELCDVKMENHPLKRWQVPIHNTESLLPKSLYRYW